MKPSELIRQRGWFGDNQAGMRMVTAALTWHGTNAFYKLYLALGRDIAGWENTNGRTAEEVIAKLEEFGL